MLLTLLTPLGFAAYSNEVSLKNANLCAVDSTTRSAYGSSLADVKWGQNTCLRFIRPLPRWDGGGRGKQDMKDDDRTLVSYELNAKKVEEAKHITPFVGRQLEVCEAFGFPVPDNCAPKYKARKVKAKRPGRPPKPKVIAEEG